MPNTYKGIYIKFRNGGGKISDVLYENVFMERPEQWPIWIGPAQQADSSNLCHGNPCSLCWPDVPFSTCNPVPNGIFSNITLRNITIVEPQGGSAGVIIGSSEYPMQNIIFDQVVVHPDPKVWWGPDYWSCKGVATGVATGNSWPVPSCFSKKEVSPPVYDQKNIQIGN
jgi:hypothetical protein